MHVRDTRRFLEFLPGSRTHPLIVLQDERWRAKMMRRIGHEFATLENKLAAQTTLLKTLVEARSDEDRGRTSLPPVVVKQTKVQAVAPAIQRQQHVRGHRCRGGQWRNGRARCQACVLRVLSTAACGAERAECEKRSSVPGMNLDFKSLSPTGNLLCPTKGLSERSLKRSLSSIHILYIHPRPSSSPGRTYPPVGAMDNHFPFGGSSKYICNVHSY